MSVRPLDVFTVRDGKTKSPVSSGDGHLVNYPRLPPIVPLDDVTNRVDPPSYRSLFEVAVTDNSRSTIYREEPPSFWERQGCLCEQNKCIKHLKSVLLFITGLIYTLQGFINIDNCRVESSLPKIIGIEGVSLFAYMIIEIILRSLSNTRYTARRSEEDIYSKQHSYFMYSIFFVTYVIYMYVLWIIGCSLVFEIPEDSIERSRKLADIAYNESWYCEPTFYDSAYYSRIAQTVIMTVIGLIIAYYWIFVNPVENQKFIKNKWKAWFEILDHDRDGVVTEQDMLKINEKLESIRIFLRQRHSPLDPKKMQLWWSSYIFRRGTNQITFEQFANCHGDFNSNYTNSFEFESHVRRCVTDFFDFFSSHEQGRNHMMEDEKFVHFWRIIAGLDESQARDHLIYFPKLLTTGDLMYAWIGLLKETSRFPGTFYQSQAVYRLLKPEK